MIRTTATKKTAATHLTPRKNSAVITSDSTLAPTDIVKLERGNKSVNQILDEVHAIHEAGHAVLALMLGGTVESIQFHDDYAWNGSAAVARCFVSHNDPEAEALINLAGAGAEILFRDNCTWSQVLESTGRGDWKKAKEAIDMMARCSCTGDRRQAVKECKTKVINLLTQHWSKVLAVATALRKKRYLSGKDVQSILSAIG